MYVGGECKLGSAGGCSIWFDNMDGIIDIWWVHFSQYQTSCKKSLIQLTQSHWHTALT